MDKEKVFERMMTIKSDVIAGRKFIQQSNSAAAELRLKMKRYENEKMVALSEMKGDDLKPKYSNAEKRTDAYLKLIESDPNQEFNKMKAAEEEIASAAFNKQLEIEELGLEFRIYETYSRIS